MRLCVLNLTTLSLSELNLRLGDTNSQQRSGTQFRQFRQQLQRQDHRELLRLFYTTENTKSAISKCRVLDFKEHVFA